MLRLVSRSTLTLHPQHNAVLRVTKRVVTSVTRGSTGPSLVLSRYYTTNVDRIAIPEQEVGKWTKTWRTRKPTKVSEYAQRAQELMEAGQYELARRDLMQVLNLSPEMSPAYIAKARCEMALENTQQAMKDLERAVQIDPKSVIAFCMMGHCLAMMGQYDKAITAYDYVLHVDKRNIDAYGGRGEVYMLLGNLEAARNDFMEILSMYPENVAAMNSLGKCSIYANDLQEAEHWYRKSLKERQSPEGYWGIGTIHYLREEAEEAVQAYSKAIELKPRNNKYLAELYNKRATAYLSLNQFEEARQDVQAAHDIHPDLNSVFYTAAQVYFGVGMYEDAVKHVTHFLDNIEGNNEDKKFKPNALLLRGMAYQGMFLESTGDESIEVEPDQVIQLNVAMQHMEQYSKEEVMFGLKDLQPNQVTYLHKALKDCMESAIEQPNNPLALTVITELLLHWKRHIR